MKSIFFSFPNNIRLDHRESKITLSPIDNKKEDFVEVELRRLKDNLRSESMKLRRPIQLSFV